MIDKQIPLCVDLDMTLLKTDILFETFLIAIKRRFSLLFIMPFWLLKGKSFLKTKIAEITTIDPALLPYRDSVINLVKKAKEEGRTTILASASAEKHVKAIADYLGIFDEVYASSESHNLKGSNKKNFLIEKFGENGYDYVGDSTADLPVWASARQAIAVGSNKKAFAELKKFKPDAIIIPENVSILKSIIKGIRVYQWVKNLLIFIPLLLAHRIYETNLWIYDILAFISFSFLASSVYIINDLLDLPSDRAHKTKSKRPFASGALPLYYGLIGTPLLMIVSFVIAASISPQFTLALLSYFIITTAYSFKLKSMPIIDILTLSGLYTFRIYSGSVAADIPITPWLLAFSCFIFLSLAVAKRFAELRLLFDNNQTMAKGRGYIVEDLHFLRSIGPLSGYLAALVFVLYINSPEVKILYANSHILWLGSPLFIYWISRIWFIAGRGLLNEDPIIFALKDKASYVVAFLLFLVLLFAKYQIL